MKNPDVVLREIGRLYDFQKELVKFRFRKRSRSNKAIARDRKTADGKTGPSAPGSGVPGNASSRPKTIMS